MDGLTIGRNNKLRDLAKPFPGIERNREYHSMHFQAVCTDSKVTGSTIVSRIKGGKSS